MTVTRFEPPADDEIGVAVFAKDGPLLRGKALIAVRSDGRCSHALWLEDVYLAGPLPRAVTRAVLRPFLAWMAAMALRAARRELQERAA